ncbi:hypothetical protein BTI06_04190 [Lactobacillus delbrueckii subsp. bulgaricus]|nr:hypothetical protein [Lactobacillus delbrueckii subsp. bulgaricus]MBT8842890.1 hypothetical protein [Lactobacillus delbrueckii subsp. bulgaricus]
MVILSKYADLVNAVTEFNAVKAKLETAEAEANELKAQANEAELEVKYYESTGELKTAWADEADQSKAGWTLYHSLDTTLVYAGQWEAVSAAVIADQISKQAIIAWPYKRLLTQSKPRSTPGWTAFHGLTCWL